MKSVSQKDSSAAPLRFNWRWLVAAVCIVLVAGCPTAPPEPPPEPEPPAAPPPKPEPPDVTPWLERARIAFEELRLTTPPESSAFANYQEALRLDPGNEDARRGLEKIVERYVQFALGAIQRHQFARARTMLQRAQSVDANHPAIEPTLQQVRLVENAEHEFVKLDAEALRNRRSAVRAQLHGLGVRAERSNCRVTINARSDEEGRWIYQQLNSAAQGSRVRARLVVASPTSVELVCLDESG